MNIATEIEDHAGAVTGRPQGGLGPRSRTPSGLGHFTAAPARQITDQDAPGLAEMPPGPLNRRPVVDRRRRQA